jgi:hypothetical protein
MLRMRLNTIRSKMRMYKRSKMKSLLKKTSRCSMMLNKNYCLMKTYTMSKTTWWLNC